MAQLDRFLAVMVSNNADSILLVEGDVATLLKDGVARPITRQALTPQQLLLLLREIAPAAAAEELAGGTAATFEYATNDRTFAVRTARPGGRWHASITLTDPSAASRNGGMSAGRVAGNGEFGETADAVPDVAEGADGGPRPAEPAPAAGPRGRMTQARTAEERADAALADMQDLLRVLVDKGASDLHLRSGEPPVLRIHGEVVRLGDHAPLDNDTMEAMMRSIMNGRNRQDFADSNDADFAYEINGVARFRCNAFRERKGAAGVFRVIPHKVVSVEELGLSAEVQNLCQLNKGLVLVTGPTGSGKSTTLCGLIDLVNRTRSDHVITIEDPIEFVHENKRCMITQRQVGQHTTSFKTALRAALREDPDIVLVGELRDLETVSIALETAETGHLVFATLHTSTASNTVDRIIDQFPSDQQEQIRTMLSESLKGVIAQTLCRKMGGGRVAAREILIVIPAVSNLIREGKTFQIPSVIQTSRRLGMVTLNDALLELVDAKVVEPREAFVKSQDKTGLLMQLKNRGYDVSFAEIEETRPTAMKSGANPSVTAKPGEPAHRSTRGKG
jgi:twitching motility protein PilT